MALWVCSFQIYSSLMKLDVINKKSLEMVIFKLLFPFYMPITLYFFSFYHVNSKAILYIVHKYKEKFESTNMNLTHLQFLLFTRVSS